MDQKERPQGARGNEDALQADIAEEDAGLLDDPAEGDRAEVVGARAVAEAEVARPLGGVPRSKVTGRHDAGSGANETEDGLDSNEEAIRHGAEDIPIGSGDEADDVPVFDRADTLPKV
jgi:hypothetical protein